VADPVRVRRLSDQEGQQLLRITRRGTGSPIRLRRAMVVLTFCLYHSPHPAQALAAIVDHLAEDGTLVITTKSADSYHEIDKTIAACTLDPGATHRPSLYESFHTDNAEAVLTQAGLTLHHRLDQPHTFTFRDADHLAEYASTSPKYQREFLLRFRGANRYTFKAIFGRDLLDSRLRDHLREMIGDIVVSHFTARPQPHL
jgi:SAM-dependent methyltransferase